jgi:acyl-CoA reductase-like NAD-dependent aldehyde dehydrogenase
MADMVLSLRDRLIYNIKDNKMKLRQQQKTKIERMLDEIEYFLEAMEQQEYMTFDLEKDLRRLSAMLDNVREEIEKK